MVQSHPRVAAKEALVHTIPAPSPVGDVTCPEGTEPTAPEVVALCPPRGADADAYRRWLASSPWPEVVFASA